MEMTKEKAEAIVKIGIEGKAWTSGMPATEPEIKKVADQLLQASLTAYGNGIKNPMILAVLFNYGVQPTAAQSYADVYEAHGQTPPAQPGAVAPQASAPAVPDAFGGAPALTPAGEADVQAMNQAAAQASAPAFPNTTPQPVAAAPALASTGGIEHIFPGYDDLKVKDIKDAILANAEAGNITPEEWEQIKAYEEANEGRKTIRELQPNFKAPEPVAASAPSPVASAPVELGSIESGYADGTLGQIRSTQENLFPAPPITATGEPVLPVDVTAVGDAELSRVAMMFHSLYARAEDALSQEEGRHKAAEHLEKDYHRKAYSANAESLKGALDKVTASALTEVRQQATLAADNDTTVAKWREAKIAHSIEAGTIKGRIAGYQSAIARLSREQSRREKIAQSPSKG